MVIVAANAGNVTESSVFASASVAALVSSGAHRAPGTVRSSAIRIGSLEPGASIEVTLPTLVVAPGTGYRLTASVGTGPVPRGPVQIGPAQLGQTESVVVKVAAG